MAKSLHEDILLSWCTQIKVNILRNSWPLRRIYHRKYYDSTSFVHNLSALEGYGSIEEILVAKDNKPWPPAHFPNHLKDLLLEYQVIFMDELDPQQHVIAPPMTVDLRDETATFMCGQSMATPIHWQDQINRDIEKLLREVIITKRTKNEPPHYLSPAHFV